MNNKRRLCVIGIIGAILNIMTAIFGMIFIVALLIVTIDQAIDGYSVISIFNDSFADATIFSLFSILYLVFSLISIVKNGKLINGKVEKKGSAVLFGFLTFSFLGAIFVLFSKVVVIVEKVKIKIVEELLDYNGLIQLISKYKQLFDSGIITEEEFKILKTNLFSQLK